MDGELKKKLGALLQVAESGALMTSMQSFYGLLRQHGLMWSQQLHCRWIGVHESNRDGVGLSPDHVAKLALDFFELGYDESLSKRICLEVDPSSASGQRTLQFNEQLVRGANQLFLTHACVWLYFCHVVTEKFNV